jgi:hypothetical protein
MRLTELDPWFLRIVDPGTWRHVDTLAEAQGVCFVCPKCFTTLGNTIVGAHRVICWSRSRGVPDDEKPGPGRWTLEGTGMADLTLGCEPGKSRSVLLISGCAWHGFVTAGEVTLS